MLKKQGRPPKPMVRPPNRIREIRESMGLTQKQLAALAGTSAQNIQKYETGDREISLSRLERIASALGVSTITLVNPSQPKEPPHAEPTPFQS